MFRRGNKLLAAVIKNAKPAHKEVRFIETVIAKERKKPGFYKIKRFFGSRAEILDQDEGTLPQFGFEEEFGLKKSQF